MATEPGPPGPPVDPSADPDAFVRELAAAVRAAEAQPPKSSGNLFLLVTMALFAITFLGDWSAMDIAILVGVVLFHELGHAAVMSLSGYRDVRVFFIPFFGAATSGKPPAAQPFKAGLVDLAGPLPGILLALALLLFAPPGPVRHSAISLLALLNVLNLVPMTPLDGGRLFDRTIVGRHPWVEIPFQIAVVALFLLGAVAWRDILLGILAFLSVGELARAVKFGLPAHELRRRFRPRWPTDLEDLDGAQRAALVEVTTRETDARGPWFRAVNIHRRAARRFPGVLGVLALGVLWFVGVVIGVGTYAELAADPWDEDPWADEGESAP